MQLPLVNFDPGSLDPGDLVQELLELLMESGTNL